MDLLQLWQTIYEDAVQLASVVERLPNDCACGDTQAHLEGRCDCCDMSLPAGEHGDKENCTLVISRLQADLMMLSQDLALGGPALQALALDQHRLELRRGVFLAANDLQQIVESFKRVTESVAGFRRDCAVSRMRAVKHHCAELRNHCEQVNAEMKNQAITIDRGEGQG